MKITLNRIILAVFFFSIGAVVTATILKKLPQKIISSIKMQIMLRDNVWPLAESVRLRESISNSKKLNLALLGDSITEWGNWEGNLGEYHFLNYGVGGNKTSDILERLSEVENKKPTLVFLMAGINDIFASVDQTETLRNYETIVKRLEAVGVKVICVSVLPLSKQNSRYLQTNESVQMLNKGIEIIAKRNSIDYFDLSRDLTTPGQFILANEHTVDSVHLNGLAYAKWMLRLEDYLIRSNKENH